MITNIKKQGAVSKAVAVTVLDAFNAGGAGVNSSSKNRTFEVAQQADVLLVHFVPEQAEELAVLFGGETGDETDKFELCAWHEGPKGVPLLDEVPNRFVGRVLDRLDLGDHVGFLLEPAEAERRDGFDELGFQEAKAIDPGHPA